MKILFLTITLLLASISCRAQEKIIHNEERDIFATGERNAEDEKLGPSVTKSQKETEIAIIQQRQKERMRLIERKEEVEHLVIDNGKNIVVSDSFPQLKQKYDEIEGVSYYLNSYFTHSNSDRGKFSIYIKQEEFCRPKLMFKVSFMSSQQYFYFDTVVLSCNNQRIYLTARNRKSDYNSCFLFLIWEDTYSTWMDDEVTQELFAFLRLIREENKVSLRIKDDTKSYDFTLSKDEKMAIMQVINGYYMLIKSMH